MAQRQDQGFTDSSAEDVSTERGIIPSVTSSEEEVTDDGFTPTEPEQRPQQVTTTRTTGQVKGTGNGRQRGPTTTTGRRGLVPSGLQPVTGNGRKPSTNGGRKTQIRDGPITQVTDGGESQEIDGGVGDVQVIDGQVSDGQVTDGQISEDGVPDRPSGEARRPSGGRVPSDGRRPSIGGPATGPGARIPLAPSVPSDEDHGGDDHHHDHSGDPIQWLRDAIRGEPGVDYPIFYEPPETSFKCADQQYPGYYADVEAQCQVFHICQEMGRSDAFLCPNGTIFSQQYFVCVWWHDFDCATAPQFYNLNSLLGQTEGSLPQEPVGPGEAPEGPVIAPTRPSGPAGTGGLEPVGPEPAGPGATRPGVRPVSRPGGAIGGPSSRPGPVPTRGRPGARPAIQAPIDAEGFGPEEPTDERIQTGVEQAVEGQEPEQPQEPEEKGITQQVGVDFDETPAPEVVTIRPTSPRAPNGRPPAGVKGGRRNGVTRKGFGYD